MKLLTLLSLSLVFGACTTQALENQTVAKTNPEPAAQNTNSAKPAEDVKKEPEKVHQPDIYDISNSLGLLHLIDEPSRKNEPIKIYNEDGSLWYEFKITDDEVAQKAFEQNEDLRPFRFDLDDFFFYFNRIGENDRYYQVIVNEDTGLKKFVRKDDPKFKAETWQQYILNCNSVGFDPQQNPLRETPDGQFVSGEVSEKLIFSPKEIKGDWLKVSWTNSDDPKEKPKFGWIRWRQDKKIVVDFFETA